MSKLIPGQIYLADQRGLTETRLVRQYSTLNFNYSNYFDENKRAFGHLEVFNDTTLAAGKQIIVGGNKASMIILIPVTGELTFKNSNAEAVSIDVGEVYHSYLPEGGSFEVINPYDADWINFLHLQIAVEELPADFSDTKFKFDFESDLNQLFQVIANKVGFNFSLHIGRFIGREEALYQLQNTSSKFFAFVIAGAFELQGRLLHQRDGLALWNLAEADMEALSNHAVILVLEMAA